MKKVTLVCVAQERDGTLEALRDMGVMHLTPVQPPEGPDMAESIRALEHAQAAVALLEAQTVPKQAAPQPASPAESPTLSEERVKQVHQLIALRKTLAEQIQLLEGEKAGAAPLGDFDPALIDQLARRGIVVRIFYRKAGQAAALPEGVQSFSIRTDESGEYFAAIGMAPFELDATPVAAPARRLALVEEELRAARAGSLDAERKLADLHGHLETLRAFFHALDERRQYLEARAGMGDTPGLAYLQGYCPTPRLDELKNAARKHAWALLIADPDPSETVPTLIRMPRWVKPIDSLFSMIKILPGYREMDISAAFLVFLSIFYALIIGDAGYGVVFLLLTAWARFKMKAAPHEPFQLMFTFNVCTIIWGVLCGTYFGMVQKAIPLPWMQQVSSWLSDNQNMIYVCLIIGATHLTIAHAWSIVRYSNSLKALSQLGWIALTWTLFFTARTMLLGAEFPTWAGWAGGIGLGLILLFMTPLRSMKTEWINHAMLPLSLMSGFGDILSYLRLFALGVAGVQLAMAFNTISQAIGFGSVGRCVGAVVVLLIGHSLNLVLCLLSVLVHGIRLNALEFSMHIGLEWSGIPFHPFARKKA